MVSKFTEEYCKINLSFVLKFANSKLQFKMKDYSLFYHFIFFSFPCPLCSFDIEAEKEKSKTVFYEKM